MKLATTAALWMQQQILKPFETCDQIGEIDRLVSILFKRRYALE
jgi:hypothetical protein